MVGRVGVQAGGWSGMWVGGQAGGWLAAGVHKTGIRGIQDTRQIVDGKTNDIENNDKKGGSRVQTLNCPVINVKLYKQDQIPF